jgi:hypothetical protein
VAMTEDDYIVHAAKRYYPEIWGPAYRAGQKHGRAEGMAEACSEDVVTILEARHVEIPDDIAELILCCRDLKQLNRWLKRAATAGSAGEVVAALATHAAPLPGCTPRMSAGSIRWDHEPAARRVLRPRQRPRHCQPGFVRTDRRGGPG